MSPAPICILYSQDPDLIRRAKAFLSALAQMRHVSSADRLDAVLQQNSPAVLILDLRAKEARDLLESIQAALPGCTRGSGGRSAPDLRLFAGRSRCGQHARFAVKTGQVVTNFTLPPGMVNASASRNAVADRMYSDVAKAWS